MLAKIAAATEAQRPVSTVRELFKGVDLAGRIRPAHLVALGVEASLGHVLPAAVLVPTRGGATARSIARFRFPVWTVAVSPLEATCRQLQFTAGVFPVHEPDSPGRWNGYAKRLVNDLGLPGDLVILTEGPSPEHPEANHRMEIIDLVRPEP
jgi:pyruvate kinase